MSVSVAVVSLDLSDEVLILTLGLAQGHVSRALLLLTCRLNLQPF